MQPTHNRATSPQRLAYVLDDEERIGVLVCKLLTACGYGALTFSTPLPFFAEIRIGAPALVILDLALGETDAVDVIRQLEILKYKGDVLLVSGRDQTVLRDVEQIGKTHGLAMLPPLQKPFRLADLKASLEAVPGIPAKSVENPAPAEATIDLVTALNDNRLEVWYQPKIDLKTRMVCGAEGLLRARHSTGGLVQPVDLLPPAQDPVHQPVTRFVLRRVLADWDRFADRQLFLKLSVNIPVSVLCAPGFVRIVREMVPTHPKFSGLIAEISADEVVRDAEVVREVAAQLKIYKVGLSIDGFGSAHSSLSRLLDMPCTELKIDRQFVANCSNDPLKHALCQTVVDLAHRVGISVCAEDIETAGDLRTLIEVGCDTAQGFLFAKPMTADVFADMLLKRRPPAADPIRPGNADIS